MWLERPREFVLRVFWNRSQRGSFFSYSFTFLRLAAGKEAVLYLIYSSAFRLSIPHFFQQ